MVKKNVQEKLNHVDCGTLKYPGCQNLFKTAAFFLVSKFKQQLFWKYHQGTKIKLKLYPIGLWKGKIKHRITICIYLGQLLGSTLHTCEMRLSWGRARSLIELVYIHVGGFSSEWWKPSNVHMDFFSILH